jgi:stage III sporulation protein AH
MNKKQAVIILTLLVLIICVGALATKMNSPLYVDVNDTASTTPSVKPTQKVTNSDYFTETKLSKTTARNQAITTLKEIGDDKTVAQESRTKAVNQATEYTNNAVIESKIEAEIVGKGYENVICWIDPDPQVRLVVQAKAKLTDQQMRSIRDVATSLSHIKTVKIDVKQ